MLYLPGEFPLDPNIAYLNHAAVSPLPKRTAEAISNFAYENMSVGATNYLTWVDVQTSLKTNLAKLINAPSSDDIALVKNTSEGLSLVAYGLDWSEGDEIVGIANEFPSNSVVWQSLSDQGVAFIAVDTVEANSPEQALFDACTPNTKLLAISSVHYATGQRLDLKKISTFCSSQNILLCVDAIQSIGAIDFDLDDTPVDFVTADGHKWMLGPEGLGFFYVNPAIRNSLKLHQFGWGMRKAPHEFILPKWHVSETATRFEAGSPNMLGIHALNASISLLLEFGVTEIERRITAITDYLIEQLSQRPAISLITDIASHRRSGIVNFSVDGFDSQSLYQSLMADSVICACRGGGIRFSPHFYTSEAQIDLALTRLDALIEK